MLASDLGGLPELVGGEAALPANDVQRWSDALRELWSDPAARRARGSDVLERARAQLSEDRYYAGLISVYSDL